MPADSVPHPSIRPVTPDQLPEFFHYLNDHLKDNGLNGAPLFQPLPRERSSFPQDKEAAFARGVRTPVGDAGWRRAWVAQGTDTILGHIDLRARPETGAGHRALLGMGVHRLARRRGLGGVLIASALAWARSATTLEWIDLEVLSVNEPALGLYRKAGFRVTGEIADMFRIDGERLAYTLMSLKLAR
jgi:ribosomal protein S18 acetylase RimI-like enzyme